MDKADNLQEERDGQCKQRDGNSKKEPKRNATDQKHHKRNDDRLITRLHLAEERISELENIPIETFKTEKQTGKRLGKKPEQTIQEL